MIEFSETYVKRVLASVHVELDILNTSKQVPRFNAAGRAIIKRWQVLAMNERTFRIDHLYPGHRDRQTTRRPMLVGDKNPHSAGPMFTELRYLSRRKCDGGAVILLIPLLDSATAVN